jgi:hypothetical protein
MIVVLDDSGTVIIGSHGRARCDAACGGHPAALCMCLESALCLSCAVSATRAYVMNRYRLQPDPADYQASGCEAWDGRAGVGASQGV